MRTGIALAASVISLGGCATYDLTLMPRGPGPMEHGVAKQLNKSVSIEIGGETFSGHYVFVQGGSFSLGTAFTGAQVATATGMGVSAVGNGNVLAQAPDGHNLRCVFTASGWSQSGTGICLTDEGKAYDLQISR